MLQQPRLCLSLRVLTRLNGLQARGAQGKEWKEVRKQKRREEGVSLIDCFLASFHYCLIIYAACHSFIHSTASRNLEAVISPAISVHQRSVPLLQGWNGGTILLHPEQFSTPQTKPGNRKTKKTASQFSEAYTHVSKYWQTPP